MTITLKDYNFSYIALLLTIIIFPISFLSHESPFLIIFMFLLLVNVSSFSGEYLTIKYRQKHKQHHKKVFLLFGWGQICFTILVFLLFKYYFI